MRFWSFTAKQFWTSWKEKEPEEMSVPASQSKHYLHQKHMFRFRARLPARNPIPFRRWAKHSLNFQILTADRSGCRVEEPRQLPPTNKAHCECKSQDRRNAAISMCCVAARFWCVGKLICHPVFLPIVGWRLLKADTLKGQKRAYAQHWRGTQGTLSFTINSH